MKFGNVIESLKAARTEAAKEVQMYDTALSALVGGRGRSTIGKMNFSTGPRRVLSKDARERIAAAQRLRWAKQKAAAKKTAKMK